MKDFLKENAWYIGFFTGLVIVIYLVIAIIVGFTNAQNQMNWCQYKDGLNLWSGSTQEETGRRWSPNPLTAGFTGECIEPGDKGL